MLRAVNIENKVNDNFRQRGKNKNVGKIFSVIIYKVKTHILREWKLWLWDREITRVFKVENHKSENSQPLK